MRMESNIKNYINDYISTCDWQRQKDGIECIGSPSPGYCLKTKHGIKCLGGDGRVRFLKYRDAENFQAILDLADLRYFGSSGHITPEDSLLALIGQIKEDFKQTPLIGGRSIEQFFNIY